MLVPEDDSNHFSKDAYKQIKTPGFGSIPSSPGVESRQTDGSLYRTTKQTHLSVIESEEAGEHDMSDEDH